MRDGEKAPARDAASHRHHVLLGDSALDKPFGVLRRKGNEAAVLDEIRVQHNEIWMTIRLLDERILVCANQVVGDAWLPASGAAPDARAQRSQPGILH